MAGAEPGTAAAAVSERCGDDACLRTYAIGPRRQANVAYGGPVVSVGDLGADLDNARAAGASASVVVLVGHGGRSAIGKVLTTWALVRITLRAQGRSDLADFIGADWLDPDPDPPIRRWASDLGIGVGETPPAAHLRSSHTGGAGRPWHVRRGEDRLLHAYWNREKGTLWREVPVGMGGKQRRLDGVLVPGDVPVEGVGRIPWDAPGLRVIEVKGVLDQTAIGQAAAGVSAAKELGARDPRGVVLVGSIDPSAPDLADVCREVGLELDDQTEHSTVITVAVSRDDPILSELDRLSAERGYSSRADALLDAARQLLRGSRDSA